MLGSQGARSIRSYVGQVAVVNRQSFREPGSGAHDGHHAAASRQVQVAVIRESRGDLDGKAIRPPHTGGLDIYLFLVLWNVDTHDGGTVTLPLARCVKPR